MKIINFEEQPANSFSLAIFDIYFEKMGMYLRRFKLCKSKAGGLYIQPPAYSKENGFGKRIWSHYVDFEGDRGKDFSKTVMEVLQPFINSLGSSEAPSF